ncbi:MAG: hypothetical protein ACFFAS_20895 [Promethearchaeota archaeon]
MFPKKIIENLVGNDVYVYIRGIDVEFAGIIKVITEDDILILQDSKNNNIHIPISLIDVLTERR